MVRVGAGIGVTGGSVAGSVTRRITVGGLAATIVPVVTAAAARLRVVIIVAGFAKVSPLEVSRRCIVPSVVGYVVGISCAAILL